MPGPADDLPWMVWTEEASPAVEAIMADFIREFWPPADAVARVFALTELERLAPVHGVRVFWPPKKGATQ